MAEQAVMASQTPFIRVSMGDGRVRVDGQAHWASSHMPDDAALGLMRGGWDWDGQRLTARVDPFGFYSLFIYDKGGELAVSSSLLELVAQGCDATQDDLALAVFHRLGIFVGDDTPLKYIKTLPPGGRLEWHQGKATITGGVHIPKAQQISRPAAVEGMITLFREAMARILPLCDGPLVLPLSGGRDSRHILLEMLHQGRKPTSCVTFHHNGARLNREAQAARALCERTGVTHDVLGHARPRLADMARVLVMTGLCADEHAQMMPMHDYFARRDVYGFDGIAGDILTNPDDSAEQFMRLSEKGDFRAIAKGMVDGHGAVISTSEWGRGAGPIYSDGRDDEVLDHVGRAMMEYADAPDPYQLFWMYHRTRREINFVPQAILSPARTVFTPYLDPAFANFCMSLPYSVTRDQELHNDAIAQAYPDMNDIPFQEGFTEPPVKGGTIRHKLRILADAWRIAGVLAPHDRRATAARWIKPRSDLKRAQGDILDLHDLCLTGLDAARARKLLDLTSSLTANAPKRLVSDHSQGTP